MKDSDLHKSVGGEGEGQHYTICHRAQHATFTACIFLLKMSVWFISLIGVPRKESSSSRAMSSLLTHLTQLHDIPRSPLHLPHEAPHEQGRQGQLPAQRPPQSGGLFGRLAERFPLTRFEGDWMRKEIQQHFQRDEARSRSYGFEKHSFSLKFFTIRQTCFCISSNIFD